VFLITIVFLIVLPTVAQEPNWYSKIKELKILSSNARDVIDLFDLHGKNLLTEKEYSWAIRTTEGLVMVNFSKGPACSDVSKQELSVHSTLANRTWNVPEWTVVEITFRPNADNLLLPIQLPFATSGMKEMSRGDVEIWSKDDAVGIILEVGLYETFVLSVTFIPPSSMASSECPALPQ